jgi:hypothetical protein
LHQECSNSGDDHGYSTVDMPDSRSRPEVTWVRTLAHDPDPVGFPLRVSGEHDQNLTSSCQAQASEGVSGGHDYYRARESLVVGAIP